jgi:hypothetical protein
VSITKITKEYFGPRRGEVKRVLIVICAATLLSASEYGVITGQLMYDDSVYVVSANITLDKTSISVITDEQGNFSISPIRAGRYTLTVSHLDWSSPLFIEVLVKGNNTTRVICTITTNDNGIPHAQTHHYLMSNAVSRIDVVTSSDISALPITDMYTLIRLQPGIIESDYGLHLRGGAGNATDYYLDGVMTSIPVSLSAIEEIQVDGHGIDPQYGLESPGVISITTQQGVKTIHSRIRYLTDAVLPGENLDYGYCMYDICFRGAVGFVRYLVAGNFTISDARQPALYRVASPGNDYNMIGKLTTFFLHGKGEIGVLGARARQQTVPWNPYTDPGNHLKYFDNRPMQRTKQALVATLLKFNITSTTRAEMHVAFNSSDMCFGTRDYQWEQMNGADWYDDYRLKGEHLITLLLDGNTAPRDVIVDSVMHYHEEWMSHGGEALRRSLYITEGLFYTIGDYPQWQYSRADDQQFYFMLTQAIGRTHTLALGAQYVRYDIQYFHNSLAYYDIPFWDYYSRSPSTYAAYIQDRIRFGPLYALIGFRYEYYDPNAFTYAYPQSLTNDSLIYSPTVERIVPRAGLRVYFHDYVNLYFNIGHSFRLPVFHSLYSSTDTVVVRENMAYYGGTILGNLNIRPENTLAYEIGISSIVPDKCAVQLTGYYKETNDIVTVQEIEALPMPYYQYENTGDGSVIGFGFDLDIFVNQIVDVGANYTLQYASTTGWTAAYHSDTMVAEPRDYPLPHDVRHTINGHFNIAIPADFELSLLQDVSSTVFISCHSGLPYTPVDLQGNPLGETNCMRMSGYVNVDWKVSRDVRIGPAKLKLFCLATNLFNTEQVIDVYNTTGLPDEHGDPEPGVGQFTYIPMTSTHYSPQGDPNHDGLITPVEAKNDYMLAIHDLYDDPTNWRYPFRLRLGIGMEF